MIPSAHLNTVLEIWAQTGKETVCTISGNSMAPLVRHGDCLVIRHGNQDIRAGDVVVFETAFKHCVHRVVRARKKEGRDSFLLKGDSTYAFDPPVTKEQILAKVVEVVGPKKRLHFESTFWRSINCLIAILSYTDAKRFDKDSLSWKALNHLFLFRSKVFQGKYFSKANLLRGVLKIHKIAAKN